MTLQRKKEVGLVVGTVVYSLLFFAAAALFFNHYEVSQAGNTVITTILVIAAFIWVAVNAITAAVISHPGSTAALIITQTAAIVIAGMLTVPAMVGAALFAASFGYARRSLAKEVTNRITYRTKLVFWKGTQLLMIGLIVAGISMAWPQVDKTVKEEGIQFKESQVETLIAPVQPVLEGILPGYKPDQTIDEIIELQFQQQLEQLPPGTEIPPAQQATIRQQIAQSLQQDLTGQESLPSVVTGIINNQLRNLTQSSPWILALIVIIVVFLTLRALIPLASWPAIGLISVLIRICQQTGLIMLSRSQATIERIHL